MVKLGFIVEGDTEKIILESAIFFNYLNSLSLEYISDVINAEGNGNLLPHNIKKHTQILKDNGATKIIILTDLDNDACITDTKTRINPLPEHTIIISVKEIEAWFLADTIAIGQFLNDPTFESENPEIINDPYNEIKSIRISKIGRGIRSKKVLAQQMIKNNFSIERAAQHENCNSAKYFLKKISEAAAKD